MEGAPVVLSVPVPMVTSADEVRAPSAAWVHRLFSRLYVAQALRGRPARGWTAIYMFR